MAAHLLGRAEHLDGKADVLDLAFDGMVDLHAHAAVLAVFTLEGLRIGEQRDRKSTRLNSSHSQISYAVFCLKKKKNKKTRRQRTIYVMLRHPRPTVILSVRVE